MGKANQKTVDCEACLIAAEQVQRKLMAIRRKVIAESDPGVRPNNPLPVDCFLDEMARRKNTPNVIFKPKRLGNHLWTENLTAYVYAGIERAFVKAGRQLGGNRSGYVKELTELRRWVERQQETPDQPVPKHFVTKTARIFAGGIMENRRLERIEVIQRIGRRQHSGKADLAQLLSWIDVDLSDPRLQQVGRSPSFLKTAFATKIARLWNTLTGEQITKKPDGNFVRFLTACWQSGFVGEDIDASFRWIVHQHFDVIRTGYP